MAYFLRLLGEFQLTRENGEPVALTGRGQALLAYLAVEGRPVSRQTLAEMLSPAGDEAELRKSLRQTVYLSRKAMTDAGVIEADENGLSLQSDLLQTDVELFERATACRRRESLCEAIDLYRGPLLDGFRSPSETFEGWLAARRADYFEKALESLLSLAAAEAEAGQQSLALEHARRALSLDPLREDAHRQAMKSLAAMNQRSGALRQYETLRGLLAAELDVLPEPETEALRAAIARGGTPDAQAAASVEPDQASGGERFAAPAQRPLRRGLWNRRWGSAALAAAIVALSLGAAPWFFNPGPTSVSDLPSLAVLRFENVNDDPAQDHLERGVVEEITAMLATYPGLRIVSRSKSLSYEKAADIGNPIEALGAQYVLEGAVSRTGDGLHVTAQLIDAETGEHLWARRFEEAGSDLAAIQQRVAGKVYESLVGFTGAIGRHEQWRAWDKPPASLQELDYVLRGEQLYFKFTAESHARARAIWQEGLAKYPDSSGLRRHLAVNYRHSVEAGWSADPEQDLARAWQMGREAALAPNRSRFDTWLNHWAMAKLAQWCKTDYDLSFTEAKAAVALVPYDATSRADLAELLANAGRTAEAIEWLQQALRLDPKGPEWYKANLAWAYYLAGRHEEARAELQKLTRPRHLLTAAVQVRLGNLPEAEAAIAALLQSQANYTMAEAARRPLVEPLKQAWLEDLRRAGLPDRPELQ